MVENESIGISEKLRHQLEQIALTEEDYNVIVSQLGREPNELELEIFGASWSEHSGYRHSKDVFQSFLSISEAPFILTRLGEENAGAIDIEGALAWSRQREENRKKERR